MGEFLAKNNSWLKYLPIVMVAMIFALLVLLVIIGISYYYRYMYHNLSSKKKKSPFALAYADYYEKRDVSTAPKIRAEAVSPPRETNYQKQMPATPIPDRPQLERDDGLIEFYFEYRDEYKI